MEINRKLIEELQAQELQIDAEIAEYKLKLAKYE